MKPSARAKLDMLEAQDRGEFGNFLSVRDINAGPDMLASGWYTLRNKERDSPYFVPVVRGVELRATIQRLVEAGASIASIYIQDIPPPDTLRLLQGEIHREPDYGMVFSLHPSVNLRDALTRFEFSSFTGSARGIMVKTLILHYAGQEAWDDLEAVLDKYPDRVVEFTVFDRPVGVLNRQTVVWEARSY